MIRGSLTRREILVPSHRRAPVRGRGEKGEGREDRAKSAIEEFHGDGRTFVSHSRVVMLSGYKQKHPAARDDGDDKAGERAGGYRGLHPGNDKPREIDREVPDIMDSWGRRERSEGVRNSRLSETRKSARTWAFRWYVTYFRKSIEIVTPIPLPFGTCCAT